LSVEDVNKDGEERQVDRREEREFEWGDHMC